MKVLLDTVAISGLRRPDRQTLPFQRWARHFDIKEAYLSAISLTEIRRGIEMERRRQTKFAEQLAFWFNEALLPEFASRVLPFDIPIALLCGGLPTPDMRFDEDTMIAATAICHELPIVTRNVSHFKRLDVSIINPWDD